MSHIEVWQDYFGKLTKAEREILSSVFDSTLNSKREDLKSTQIREIVPVEQWLESEYYLGPDVARIYDYWKQFIADVINSKVRINELIIDGCLNENTRIPTTIGILSLKELSDRWVKGQSFEVLSEEGVRLGTQMIDKGESPTRILQFHSGKHIEATNEHRLKVVRNGVIDWVYVSDLIEGDLVVCSGKESPFGSNSLLSDKHLALKKAYVLGGMSGDGCITGSRGRRNILHLNVLKADSHCEQTGKWFFEVFGKGSVYHQKTNNGVEIERFIVHSQTEADYLLANGFGHLAVGKDIPEFIFSAPKDEVAAYIRGLFDADGSVSDPSKADVSICLRSKNLIDNLQLLLSNFGIQTRVSSQKNGLMHRLRLVGYRAFVKFEKEIGFQSASKASRLNHLTTKNPKSSSRQDVFPFITEELLKIFPSPVSGWWRKEKLFFNWHNNTKSKFYKKGSKSGSSFYILGKFKEAYSDLISTSTFLSYVIGNDCYFDEIVEIKDSRAYCRDLSVQQSPSYIFNGFLSHNSIGTGKSTVGEFIVLRKLYELSCFKNIQAKYNLMLKSPIMFFYFSVTKAQAETTGYGSLKNLIDSIQYFRDEFPREKKFDRWLYWPQENLAVMYGSNPSHAIGMNMLLSVMDEANFMGREGAYERTDNGQLSKAAQLYENTRQRAKSRFLVDGEDKSMSILISSSTHESSFTEDRKRKSMNDPHVRQVTARLWDVKGHNYSKTRFWVCVGNRLIDPFICDTVNDLNQFLISCQVPTVAEDADIAWEIQNNPYIQPHRLLFVDVPIDFKSNFESDIVSSLQNIAGVSVAPVGKLFTARPILVKAYAHGKSYDPPLRHPFTKEQVEVSTHDEGRLEDFFQKDFIFRNPNAPRFAHIDQSTTTDSTGISQVFIDRFIQDNGVVKPVICVDFMLKINPPRLPQKISISKIRDFLFWLQDNRSLTYGFISYDTFGSQESMQLISERGINTKIVSMDRTDEPYTNLVSLIFEERLHSYLYPPFEDDFLNLIHNRTERKVSHTKEHGKDVSDSLAGAVWNALKNSSLASSMRSDASLLVEANNGYDEEASSLDFGFNTRTVLSSSVIVKNDYEGFGFKVSRI